MNENQTNQNQETNNEVAVEVKESKIKKAASKAGGFVKKHGKKMAVGALALAGMGLLAASKLRKRDSDVEYDYDDEDFDDEELKELVEMELEESEEEQ